MGLDSRCVFAVCLFLSELPLSEHDERVTYGWVIVSKNVLKISLTGVAERAGNPASRAVA